MDNAFISNSYSKQFMPTIVVYHVEFDRLEEKDCCSTFENDIYMKGKNWLRFVKNID